MFDREQSGLAEIASWIHALVTLDDARIVAILAKAVREARPLSDPLARFIREYPGQMRTLR